MKFRILASALVILSLVGSVFLFGKSSPSGQNTPAPQPVLDEDSSLKGMKIN